MDDVLNKLSRGGNLTSAEAESAMEEILSGRVAEDQIVVLLRALREKGETAEELVGFAKAMRRHVAPVFPGGRPKSIERLVDTCGTGGDGVGTFNISTAAAFVVAGAGARVAKHGNRSISSRCGSADVLEALGVNLMVPPERAGAAILEVGIGFLFAPALHTAMKHAMPARRKLGGRTVFNLLGPLTNPADATVQVIGVYESRLVELLARALAALGTTRAFVVHSADGMDEISISGETYAADVRSGKALMLTLTPEEFGLRRAPREGMSGGDAQHNAQIIRDILSGERGPRRDIVIANSAAALLAACLAADFLAAAHLAAQSIDSGAAQSKLDALIAFTNA